MAFVPAPNIVKIAWFYTLNGEPAMNRLHVNLLTAEPTAGDCATLAAAAADWWVTTAAPLVSVNMSLREVQAVSLAVQNGPQATFSAGLPQVGAVGGDSLPGNVAFCISLRTGLSGRSARGRWFWGGLAEGQVTANVVNSGVVTSIVSAIDGLINAIEALSAIPTIVSYVSNNAPRVGGPVYFNITDALAVDAIVDSQRGRLH